MFTVKDISAVSPVSSRIVLPPRTYSKIGNAPNVSAPDRGMSAPLGWPGADAETLYSSDCPRSRR